MCKKYSQYVELKKNHQLELKDAREEHELVSELMNKGFDINNGVIAIIDDEVFQGKDAVRKVEAMSLNNSLYQKMMNWVIETPVFHLAYPIMTKLRILLLKIKNRNTHIPTMNSVKRQERPQKVESNPEKGFGLALGG